MRFPDMKDSNDDEELFHVNVEGFIRFLNDVGRETSLVAFFAW